MTLLSLLGCPFGARCRKLTLPLVLSRPVPARYDSRAEILAAAIKEIASRGPDRARVDAIANRHTFGHVFGRDLGSRRNIEHNRELIIQMILRFVGAGPNDGEVAGYPPHREPPEGARSTLALVHGAGTGRGDGPSYAGK